MPIYISPPPLPRNDDAQDFLTSVFLTTVLGSQYTLNLIRGLLLNIALSSYLLRLTKATVTNFFSPNSISFCHYWLLLLYCKIIPGLFLVLNSVVLVALVLSEILPPLHDSHTKLVSCRNNLSQTVPAFVLEMVVMVPLGFFGFRFSHLKTAALLHSAMV